MIKLYVTTKGEWFTSVREAESVGRKVEPVEFDENLLCTYLNMTSYMLDKPVDWKEAVQ
jgi:hypothetical protein